MAVCQYLNEKVQNKLETKKEKGEKFAINDRNDDSYSGIKGANLDQL